ncbi:MULTISPECIES: 23S rRNA (uracil(1939)-C(5))-methyltransferase RlmD [unclassified Vibrio]|uniref:23S rRNA (uracil(1939)-C(5))-methyltransferase RlmD n=1 Tax=unclassified Vibrio TaxID=2614977 RepID=UPI000B8EDA10|nr:MULTISPECIES: 23S rRNA (uracil(1939)-C(5))-methyltransferase RlmD [unclassified Vibrio]NAW91568.1 23S rRNA (uracil(1939)-C(5))-methyltransferase RlmD [Vibrio sp. V24_P1S3T111]OXX20228.1 23S rRNA (uracil(1939)-C(5))-methyltransferase [Vibrio sp. V05_P4A8T149]OXX27376.1 23S rRNA (uracil(1939)-C(5))-methyltransferase [Vibrio sp. V06_P1A73T115]OXX28292.1 23S rRNA (uracil(1939)-C(5))-methyltransferase [Vibrio sp. V14_P6S14T42]OXX33501.1 23S rRNA (uracil(1939)-C(5))-methyltransferase [Vibrio sp. 
MARFFQPKKKTQLETKHQTVLIERLDHQGAGIAYQHNKLLFVDGALPGEQVLMQLTESKSKYSRGQLIKVLTASEQRVMPFCRHYDQCGGCDLQHLEHSAQVAHKEQTLSQLMSKFAGQTLALSPAISCADKGYRRRARISVLWDKKQQQLQFGFRKKQSKQIVNVTDCPVLEPQLNTLLTPIQSLLTQFKSQQAIGHVELVLGDQGAVMVLRHLQPLPSEDHAALLAFAQQYHLTLYVMPESDQLERLHGEMASYSETGPVIEFLPSNFIQVNRQVNQKMVAQALEWLALTEDDRVLDLFCGVGNFSLPMAQYAQSVVGIEGVDEMVEQATQNAPRNQIDNISFYQANLEQDMSTQAWAKQKFAKVLLDPARAGAAGIVDQLAKLGAQRVVYVSCNPATLARDSQSLLSQGYKLMKLGMLDMFPHTSHLESMALFVKSR